MYKQTGVDNNSMRKIATLVFWLNLKVQWEKFYDWVIVGVSGQAENMQVKPVLETQPTLDDILMTVCKLLYKNNNKQEKKETWKVGTMYKERGKKKM